MPQRILDLTRPKQVVLAIATVLLVVAVGFSAAGLFVFGRYRPMTVAMEPTLHSGDYIWTRPAGKVGRGDIVLLTPPPRPDSGFPPPPQLAIERVVAIGGDTVEAKDGRLIVNGRPVDEPYLAKAMTTGDIALTTVPKGRVFYLGDNRHNTASSNAFGPVPESTVKQRVVWTAAPPTGLVLVVTLAFACVYAAMCASWLRRR